MREHTVLNRRKFMKTVSGGTVTATTVGLAGCIDSAKAQIQAGVFDTGDIHLESEDGEPEELRIENIEVVVEYEHFDADPVSMDFALVGNHPDEPHKENLAQINSDHSPNVDADAPDGTITKTADTVDLINVWGLQAFTAGDGGDPDTDNTESWEIGFELHVEVIDEDNRIFEKEVDGSSLVEVTNLGTGDDGDGEATIETGGSGDITGGPEA